MQLETGLWSLELFHGPTLAFKDMAMQLLGRLFDLVLGWQGERITIVGATSGDTGSAAIEACRDRPQLDVVILHPAGRTSEVQRRQMTTVAASNIANIAVDGTFDDCQDLVKAMFADAPFRRDLRLSAVNSINWARVAAQIPYYVAAAVALGSPDREVAFSVPSGNFGNVLAAWAARRMGVPIARLIVGSNRNDILSRFLDSQRHELSGASSPACRRAWTSRSAAISSACCSSCSTATRPPPPPPCRISAPPGPCACPDAAWHRARTLFHGFRLDDAGTLAEIRRLDGQGYLADPHTAIGIAAARAHPVPAHPVRRRRDRAPRQVPGCDAKPQSAGAPLCHRGSPTYMTGLNIIRARPTTSDPSRRRCALSR